MLKVFLDYSSVILVTIIIKTEANAGHESILKTPDLFYVIGNTRPINIYILKILTCICYN